MTLKQTGIYAKRWMDNQTDKNIDWQTDGQTISHIYTQTLTQTDKWATRYTQRESGI